MKKSMIYISLFTFICMNVALAVYNISANKALLSSINGFTAGYVAAILIVILIDNYKRS